MKKYPWLYQHFEKISLIYQSYRKHHALLIQAIPGMGKDTLIHAVICSLVCKELKKSKHCGKCKDCLLVQKGMHPDNYILELKKGEMTIGIEVVREIIKRIYRYAYLNDIKIIWLKDAEKLTEAAANALLKILEEPPKNTYFLLSCHDKNKILITLRSRCLIYNLNVPEESWTISWIAREVVFSLNEQISALRLCNGAPIAARELLSPEIWLQRKRLYYIFSRALQNGDWFALFKILNDELFLQKLFWLFSLLLDAIKLKKGITLLNNIDMQPLLDMLANHLTYTVMHTTLFNIYDRYKRFTTITGMNREILLVDFLLYIEDILQ